MKKNEKYLFPHLTLGQLVLFLSLILFVTEVSGEIYFAMAAPHKMRGKLLSFLLDRDRRALALSFPSKSKKIVMVNGTAYPVEKREDVFRIIILGGSAAQGFGTAVHKSWGHLLGERLQESLGETVKKVEVINMAAGAYTSIDDYINFMLTGVHLTPDLVIIYRLVSQAMSDFLYYF